LKPRDRSLLEIFSAEQAEHVSRLRALTDALAGGDASTLEEALRRAHTLKGAARAVGLEQIESLAHRLEAVFARARAGAAAFDAAGAAVVHRALDAVEDVLAAVLAGREEPDTSAARQAIESLPGAPPSERHEAAGPAREPHVSVPGAAGTSAELVRVDAASIDELIRTSSQLFAAITAESAAGNLMEEHSLQTAEALKQWLRLRRQCAPYVRRKQEDPEFAPVAECLNYIDGQIRLLGAGARSAAAEHRRRDRDLRRHSEDLQHHAVRVRMTAAETEFGGFGAMVRDLAREEGKQVEFRAEGLEAQADRAVLQGLKDSVMHLLRNAVSHGIETPGGRAAAGKPASGSVRLRVDAVGGRLSIAVEDDGRGIDTRAVLEAAAREGAPAAEVTGEEALRLIFRPGLSTSRRVTNLAGRGIGLSVVQQAVSGMQGEIRVEPRAGGGTTFTLSVPLSISTHHVLLLGAGGYTFGVPARFVERLCRVGASDVRTMDGRESLVTASGPVRLARLSSLLGVAEQEYASDGEERDKLQVAILALGDRRAGMVVDRFVDDREAVVKDLGVPRRMAGMTSGGIVLEDGTVAPVLDPAALFEKFHEPAGPPVLKPPAEPVRKKPRRILVVDDSITTRSLEKSILEAHGYEVRLAVDGVEALERLRADAVDLVITDIMMPRMDGMQLLQEIRKDRKLAGIPVIVVTSLERREEQERGLSLGADAYIVKRKFDQRELLNTVRQIL